MLTVEPFRPYPSGTVNATSAGSNATAALTTGSALPGNISVRIFNSGTAVAFVEFGGAASVAAVTTTSMPIPGGGVDIVNIDQAAFAAVITAGSTATVYFTRGYGI